MSEPSVPTDQPSEGPYRPVESGMYAGKWFAGGGPSWCDSIPCVTHEQASEQCRILNAGYAAGAKATEAKYSKLVEATREILRLRHACQRPENAEYDALESALASLPPAGGDGGKEGKT